MCGAGACAWGAGVDVLGRPQPGWAGLSSPVLSPSPLLTWLWRKPQKRGPGGKRQRPRTGRGLSAAGPWWAARRQWVAAGRSVGPAGADPKARAPAEGKDNDFAGAARAAVPWPERRHSAPWRPERSGEASSTERYGLAGEPAPPGTWSRRMVAVPFIAVCSA